MKDLINALLKKLGELRQQANDNLAKMKPLEQQEGAEQIGFLFRSARNIVEYLTEISSTLEGKLTETAEQLRVTIRQELMADEAFKQEVAKDQKVLDAIKAQLIQGGDLLTKTDHEGKVQAAEAAREKAVKEQIQQEAADGAKISQRRGEAVVHLTEKLKKLGDGASKVATEVAAKLTPEQLAGEGYMSAVQEVGTRVESCLSVGVKKSETLQEVAAMDAKIFSAMHGGWKEQAAQSGRSGAPLATRAGHEEETSDEDKNAPVRIMV